MTLIRFQTSKQKKIQEIQTISGTSLGAKTNQVKVICHKTNSKPGHAPTKIPNYQAVFPSTEVG
uniref:Uncharacterized protein n=1 Tax=Arundo donax TaxID=35708 RepID=A0A0A8Z513_ARUDO